MAENVAINLVEIGNLANFGNSANGTMTRTLDLPVDVAGKAYMINLINSSQTAGQLDNTTCYVKTYLVTNPTLSAMSVIPMQANQSQIVLGTNEKDMPAGITYGPIYGGADNTVVWAWKGSGITRAGIGRLTGGG